MDYWRNEVKILNTIAERAMLSHVEPTNLIKYHGICALTRFDDQLMPHVHPCIIFGLAGDSISRLIKYCISTHKSGIPIECVKKIMRDSLTGLKFLHAAGIIHTDIKPSNLLLDCKIESAGMEFNTMIGDFGSSTPADDLFSKYVGTTEYCAPELILEHDYTYAVDIWALFVSCFEMVTGDVMFDIFRETEMSYGDDVDHEGIEGLVDDDDSNSEMSDDCAVNIRESKSTSKSSESSTDDSELIGYRHLLLIEKLLGGAPKSFAKVARQYYNARGKLKNNPQITRITISDLLQSNYNISADDCATLDNFLREGLKYNADGRISAELALQHPWLAI